MRQNFNLILKHYFLEAMFQNQIRNFLLPFLLLQLVRYFKYFHILFQLKLVIVVPILQSFVYICQLHGHLFHGPLHNGQPLFLPTLLSNVEQSLSCSPKDLEIQRGVQDYIC